MVWLDGKLKKKRQGKARHLLLMPATQRELKAHPGDLRSQLIFSTQLKVAWNLQSSCPHLFSAEAAFMHCHLPLKKKLKSL